MNNPDIAKYGENTQFQKGKSGNPAGRKPSRLKKFIKEYDVTKADIDMLFKNIIFNYTPKELFGLVKPVEKGGKGGDDLPAAVAVFVSGILQDIKRGDMKVVGQILDRVYGKAGENIKLEATTDDVTNLTPEQRHARIADLLQKANEQS